MQDRETSIENFLGTWHVREWQQDSDKLLPEALVAKGDRVTLTPNGELCNLQWTGEETFSKLGAALSPLTYSGGQLQAGQVDIRDNGGQKISLAGITATLTLTVSLLIDHDIGSGNAGVIIAESQPIGEEPPSHGWRRALRRLLRRIDKLLAEA